MMSLRRLSVVVVSFGYIIGVAGWSDIHHAIPAIIDMLGVVAALVVAFVAVSHYDQRFLDQVAKSL